MSYHSSSRYLYNLLVLRDLVFVFEILHLNNAIGFKLYLNVATTEAIPLA